MSTAFNTVNHTILLNRLKYCFGVVGTALSWIGSYLIGRTQKLVIDGYESEAAELTQGVPQGWVLDPVLFILYTSPLGDICQQHHINFHSYADDQQIYLSFQPSSQHSSETCLTFLQNCIKDIRLSMKTNLLKLNNGKTEFLIVGTRQKLELAGERSIQIGNVIIRPTPFVWNLVYIYDLQLNNNVHVSKLACSLYITVRKISRVRHLVDLDTAKILVQTFILSRLDYCNSLLQGSSKLCIDKLQSLQNMACRIVYRQHRFCRMTPLMKALHWLKVPDRITYKIALLMYKCVKGLSPEYLIDIVITPHRRRFRLTTELKLPVIKSMTAQVHKCSFASMGPSIWNGLPKKPQRSSINWTIQITHEDSFI